MTEAVKGALVALALSPLVTLVFAYTFRIPIPFACYIGPFGEINSYSMSILSCYFCFIAWMFFDAWRHFCSSIVGCAHRLPFKIQSGLCYGAVVIFVMSILDLLIGPW